MSIKISVTGHTTIIHRVDGLTVGYREVTDDAARIAVRAFPFADAVRLARAGRLPAPGAYLLCGAAQVYVGETGKLSRRLVKHAADRSKSFATEVYAIAAFDGPPLEKPWVQYLQARLTEQAEAARLARVVKGVAPHAVCLRPTRVATLEHMLDDALRLLFDAGCRVFDSCEPPRPEVVEAVGQATSDEFDDHELMEVGVADLPAGAAAYELDYGIDSGRIWARGYHSQGRFVVVAGSEYRAVPNPSAQPRTRARHQRLIKLGALVPIPGVKDRLRSVIGVGFPSMATAAKAVCAGHVNALHWQPVPPRVPFIVTEEGERHERD